METQLNFSNEKKIHHGFDDSVKGRALYKVIFGILDEWSLSQQELSTLVNRTPTTISEWKKKESISVSKHLDMNDYQLLEFIELYKVLTNLFVFTKDRTSWLREPNEGFGNKSPLDLIKSDPRNLHTIRLLMSKIANP